MSFFSSILSKLGIGSAEAAEVESPVTGQPATGFTPAAAAISEVDVVAKLEGMAASHPEKLNWKTSIVDMLKLLGLDSSLSSRKELATELGCPTEKWAILPK